MSGLNKNNSAVKRIMQEARELAKDPSTDYTASPLEDDIFEWHCTLRGPSGTEFEGGLYHFRLLLPAEYPFKAPSIVCLTPNGRFELNTKICISFTSYHEEMWQPAWGVRTAIVGLQGFFPLRGTAAVGVGSIEAPPNERKRLASLSRDWKCPHCETSNLELLPDPSEGKSSTNSDPVTPTVPIADANEQVESVPDAAKVDDEMPLNPIEASPPPPALELPPTPSTQPQTPIRTPTYIQSQSQSQSSTNNIQTSRPTVSSHRHLRLIDTLIFVLLGLVCAMVCRRMV